MLKIRLQRVGRKNDPSFRLVVTDSRNSTKSGKFLEVLGSYDARHNRFAATGDRIKHWLANGAQASVTVHNLLIRRKVITGKKLNAMPKRKKQEKTVDAPAA
jgi:small subunit ribosomal protein S16